MAFPTVKGRSGGSSGTSQVTSQAITFPAHASGDLLVIFFASDASASGPTHTFDGGFTEAKDFLGTTSSTPTALAVAYKVAASSSETCTVTLSQTEKVAFVTLCYDSGTFNSDDPLGVSTGAEGVSAAIDPDSLTNAGGAEDVAWVAFGSLDQGQAVTAAPTNYANLQTQSSGGGGSATAATAERDLNAASEDPGAFTNTSEDWTAVTVGIRPTAAAGGVALAGSSAGSSTASGVLSGEVPLAGTSVGASTAQGILSGEVPLAASAAGSSSATGVLSGDVPLVASAAGASSATGVLTTEAGGEIALAGTAAGSSTASGTLSGEVPLQGTSGGTSTASGVLSGDVPLQGLAEGSSTGLGNLTVEAAGQVEFQGLSAGSSTASGSLSLTVGLQGLSEGDSTATGALARAVSLSGDASGTSTTQGTLSALIALEGLSEGSSTAAGALVIGTLAKPPKGPTHAAFILASGSAVVGAAHTRAEWT